MCALCAVESTPLHFVVNVQEIIVPTKLSVEHNDITFVVRFDLAMGGATLRVLGRHLPPSPCPP